MPETELAATLVRILTGPRTDVERRDMRFIRDIVKQELKEVSK
jgi:hypothetical protein